MISGDTAILAAVAAANSAEAASEYTPGRAGTGDGQVRFIARPKSRTMRAKRKNVLESQQSEGAEMAN